MTPEINRFLQRYSVEFTGEDYADMCTSDKLRAILAVDHMYQVLMGDRLTDLARQHRREDLGELIEALWHKEK